MLDFAPCAEPAPAMVEAAALTFEEEVDAACAGEPVGHWSTGQFAWDPVTMVRRGGPRRAGGRRRGRQQLTRRDALCCFAPLRPPRATPRPAARARQLAARLTAPAGADDMDATPLLAPALAARTVRVASADAMAADLAYDEGDSGAPRAALAVAGAPASTAARPSKRAGGRRVTQCQARGVAFAQNQTAAPVPRARARPRLRPPPAGRTRADARHAAATCARARAI
jgi:hypothetical protein